MIAMTAECAPRDRVLWPNERLPNSRWHPCTKFAKSDWVSFEQLKAGLARAGAVRIRDDGQHAARFINPRHIFREPCR